MKTETITLPGDVPGHAHLLRVLTFAGSDAGAPSAYLQASLHAGEIPGAAALHFLVPMLQAAEAEGRMRGTVTVVPQANPIGAGQWLMAEHMGRYDLFSRTNFNRDHILRDAFDAEGLPAIDAPVGADKRLKALLQRLSRPHDIVLDLHCDDESENYFYCHQAFWPGLEDLAQALHADAVLVWSKPSDAEFEEAGARPFAAGSEMPGGRKGAVATIEFRGVRDVSAEQGRADADGLMRFLVGRGIVAGEAAPLPAFTGPVTPLENVEMIRAPEGGMVFFHVAPGDDVAAGQPLVTIVPETGNPARDITLTAPQAGHILTRRSLRLIRRGEDLVKLLGHRPTAAGHTGGALESR